MSDFRLGDVIDDHCIKCRRITNHAIVSIINAEPAKVRCRTCYHDHDFRNGQAPPSKKDLKKQELFNKVLSAMGPATGETTETAETAEADPPSEDGAQAKPAAKKAAARGKKA